jgi:hypothetical protein
MRAHTGGVVAYTPPNMCMPSAMRRVQVVIVGAIGPAKICKVTLMRPFHGNL